ncbi:hypothetical protein EUX98_g6403 [Antrodiella citrinella]|uniref:Zn(2)-C6 fungal-type domain-containing protein n=1 Tax=Antrodiella citrinella TaxID=2447956 RepID=A0A4S4MQX1_9APHY|nr:hypothetical protein EUX98_g6403 [Antrodiella citrinella]
MRTYITPVSSSPSVSNSIYPSPISSRSTSPHPRGQIYADVQATPRVSISHSASGQQQQINILQNGEFVQPQHWDEMRQQQQQAQMQAQAQAMMEAQLFSDPGVEIVNPPKYKIRQSRGPHRPTLFAHHTTSGVGRRDGPYPTQVTQFVHIPASSMQQPVPKLRTQQACEACRKRKAKVYFVPTFAPLRIDVNFICQCTGDRPSCGRCLSRDLECQYAVIDERARLQTRRAKMLAKSPGGLSSVERARLQRRHAGQDVFRLNGQTYVAVNQQTMPPSASHDGQGARPGFMKYASEGGGMYAVEMDGSYEEDEMDVDEMEMDMGAMCVKPGSASGSEATPQIMISQPGSQHQITQYLQQRQSNPGYTPTSNEEDGETELVVVEIPKRSTRHSLLDLLNPVSVHPLSMFEKGSMLGRTDGSQGEGTRQQVQYPATTPTMAPSSLPVMIDPTLSTDLSESQSPPSRASSASSSPPSKMENRAISAVLAANPSAFSHGCTPPRPIRNASLQYSTASTPSDHDSSIGVGMGTSPVDDLNLSMGWLETMHLGIPAAISASTLSVANVYGLSIPDNVEMYRTITAASSVSEYSNPFDAAGAPLSRGTSSSSTSAEPGTPQYLDGDELAITVEMQEMFERIMGEAIGDNASNTDNALSSLTQYASPTSSSSSFSDVSDDDVPAADKNSGPKSAPAMSRSHSLIPRAIVTQASQPLPPTRSGSQPQVEAASPELSFGSFMSGDENDAFGAANESLLDETFNFDEFMMVSPDEEAPPSSDFLSVPRTQDLSVSPLQPSTPSNTPNPPTGTPSLPTSASATSTLGEHSKSLMESVLSFVASQSAQAMEFPTSCSAEIRSAQSGLGLSEIGQGEGEGEYPDVIMMTSPVLVQ